MSGWEKRLLLLDHCLKCFSSSQQILISSCLKINTTLSTWYSGKYKNVVVRTLLFFLMLLTLCMTLGTELLFSNPWNGNRTTCLTWLRLTQFLWGSYDINYAKIVLKIQIIIQNLGRHLRFWVVQFLCFLHSAKFNFFHVSDFLSSAFKHGELSLSSPMYLILHLSTTPFLFSPLLPTHCLLFLSGNLSAKSCSLASFPTTLQKSVLKWPSHDFLWPFHQVGST